MGIGNGWYLVGPVSGCLPAGGELRCGRTKSSGVPVVGGERWVVCSQDERALANPAAGLLAVSATPPNEAATCLIPLKCTVAPLSPITYGTCGLVPGPKERSAMPLSCRATPPSAATPSFHEFPHRKPP